MTHTLSHDLKKQQKPPATHVVCTLGSFFFSLLGSAGEDLADDPARDGPTHLGQGEGLPPRERGGRSVLLELVDGEGHGAQRRHILAPHGAETPGEGEGFVVAPLPRPVCHGQLARADARLQLSHVALDVAVELRGPLVQKRVGHTSLLKTPPAGGSLAPVAPVKISSTPETTSRMYKKLFSRCARLSWSVVYVKLRGLNQLCLLVQ